MDLCHGLPTHGEQNNSRCFFSFLVGLHTYFVPRDEIERQLLSWEAAAELHVLSVASAAVRPWLLPYAHRQTSESTVLPYKFTLPRRMMLG